MRVVRCGRLMRAMAVDPRQRDRCAGLQDDHSIIHEVIRCLPTRPSLCLLIEWPEDEIESMKFWLSTLDATVTFAHLVYMTKMRWRIERDYLELKQEVGLGHYEGRSWRGFHHHATLCIASYAFLVSERAAFPPSGSLTRWQFAIPAIPEGYSPRGAAVAH